MPEVIRAASVSTRAIIIFGPRAHACGSDFIEKNHMSRTLGGNPDLVDSGFDTAPNDPFVLLEQWLALAKKLNIREPLGMTLATVDTQSHPSTRTILLKSCDKQGLVFVSSENSFKGKQLEENPWAAGTLWWRETNQQIHFQGKVKKLSEEKADELFYARPRASQAAAELSNQSAHLENELELKNAVLALAASDAQIKRPQRWRAFCLMPETIEFWLGYQSRFHRRLRYTFIKGIWTHGKLQP